MILAVMFLLLLSAPVLLTVALWSPARRIGSPWLLLVPVARERMLGRLSDRCALPGKPTDKAAGCTIWSVLLLIAVVLLLLLGIPVLVEAFTTVREMTDPEAIRDASLPGAAMLLGILGGFAAAFLGLLLLTGIGAMLALLHVLYAVALWPLFRTLVRRRAVLYELLYIFIPPVGAILLMQLVRRHPDFPPEAQEAQPW